MVGEKPMKLSFIIIALFLISACSTARFKNYYFENSFLGLKKQISVKEVIDKLGPPSKKIVHEKLGKNIFALIYRSDDQEYFEGRLTFLIDSNSDKVVEINYMLRKEEIQKGIKYFEDKLEQRFKYREHFEQVADHRYSVGIYKAQRYLIRVKDTESKQLESISLSFRK